MFSLVLTLLWAQAAPPPVFTDPQRREKIAAALPAIERIFERYHRERQTPGLAYGVIADGQLVAVKTYGLANRERNLPVTPDTRFRIASMTKSFTALAILKLRDEGKLSLDDHISRWIPETARWQGPTSDSEPLRIRHLLTHGAGFPEDNPWGDQQLGITDAELNAWLRKGLPYSTAPGTMYEYSNYGFALLGRIIERAAKRPYRQYVEKEILQPLGMNDSTLEPTAAPAEATAVGYRPNGLVEPSLRHGGFGAMGGLLTTARDLAKYIAFQLDAFPARDGADAGPVTRASRREMQTLQRYATTTAVGTHIRSAGYGYGLRVTYDCAFGQIVTHGGGLPGFGSNMTWLPQHGIGILSMTNLTYAGPSAPALDAIEELRRTGALAPRAWPVSSYLREAQTALTALYNKWDDAQANRTAAMNLFPDRPVAERRAEIASIQKQVGTCRAMAPVQAANWLRGTFRLACERGQLDMDFTLAPTNPPTVQHWALRPVLPLSVSQQELATRHSGECTLGEVVSSDGNSQAVVELRCARGTAQLAIDGDKAVVRRAGPEACLLP